MAHETAVVHESHTALIWKVFGFLSFITIVEVILGISKPPVLHLPSFLGTSPLNWIFLILTLVKAYGITWYFMHMKDEKASLRRAVVWTSIFLICFLATLLLIEGSYLAEVTPYVKWDY
ncbi:MAG: cytochrome C oxidase subunit IV family protein [Flavobacteriaceae bacterium]